MTGIPAASGTTVRAACAADVMPGVAMMRTACYDAENRMISETDANGTTATYVYDGDSRRVSKTLNGVTTTFVYDPQGQLAQDYGGPTIPLSETGTRYVTTDHLGSTRLLTKADGTVAVTYDYLPFGMEFAQSTDTNRIRFTGKERDAESGLDYFEARYLSSAQGRFMNPDSGPWLLSNPQSYNAYTYALNNPLRYIDEEGLTAKDRVDAANALAAQTIPYIKGGGHPGNKNENCGLDCSGLVYNVFKADPDNTIKLGLTATGQDAAFQADGEYTSDINKAQAGDAIFWTDDSGHVVHAGIVVDIRDGKIYFVHAPRPGKNVNKFYVKVSTGGNLGTEKFAGLGRPIEHPIARLGATPQNGSGSLLNRLQQWGTSWSFFGKPSPPDQRQKQNNTTTFKPCKEDDTSEGCSK